MEIKRYSIAGVLQETHTIEDPDIYNDTESIIMRSNFVAAPTSVMTYDSEPSKISIQCTWHNLSSSTLQDILDVLNYQNTYRLTYTYNTIEYYVYVHGPFDYVQETDTEYYTFSITIESIGYIDV